MSEPSDAAVNEERVNEFRGHCKKKYKEAVAEAVDASAAFRVSRHGVLLRRF